MGKGCMAGGFRSRGCKGCACACCGICLGCALLCGILGPVLLSSTIYRPPWIAEPGDDLRMLIQDDVLAAFGSGDWNTISTKYDKWKNKLTSILTGHDSVLIIGNASGEHFSKAVTTHGTAKITFDTRVPMASQTKIIAALTIYRLMMKYPNNLTLDTRPGDLGIAGWPATETNESYVSQVKLRHLLSFTTGLEKFGFATPGCARDESLTDTNNWESCLTEIGGYNFAYQPGTTWQYGPWHLFMAAGMAMKAANKPLTKQAWEQVVTEEVFAPSGLTSTAYYGTKTWNNPKMPDVSGGIEMTAQEWAAITSKLQFGNLLPPGLFATFTQDHTYNVVTEIASLPYDGQYMGGGWHYAQGHYRACDALTTDYQKKLWKEGTRYNWKQANQVCNFTLGIPESGPVHNVQHSSGMFGSYVWMDLTHGYYGVFVMYVNIEELFFKALITFVCATAIVCVVSCICGASICFLCKKDPKKDSESDEDTSSSDPEAVDNALE